MRFFAGLSVEEVADVLKVSKETVMRDWRWPRCGCSESSKGRPSLVKNERWQQVERLYHAVLTKPPDERSSFLVEVCAVDEELRREVESLLAYKIVPKHLLSRPHSTWPPD